MAKHSENDFVIPALKALYNRGGTAMMSDIKDDIGSGKYIELSEEDLSMFASRTSRQESRYRQVVGNIVSHHNNSFFEYAYIEKQEENGLPKGSIVLNEKGIEYVSALISDEKSMEAEYNPEGEKEIAMPPDDFINDLDRKIIDIAKNRGLDKRPPTDTAMHEAVLDINGRECLYAKLIGAKHDTFLRDDGKKYMISHHLIPMSARKDFFPKNLDRPSNIVCLCPNCHDKIHHGSKDEKDTILNVLYNYMIDALEDEDIYISYNKLLDKYY